MDGKKSWPLMLVLAIGYGPRLVRDWFKRHVLRVEPRKASNPSRAGQDKGGE